MISKILDPILNIFRFHKIKLLALLFFYVVFLYFLFPFNDLGDLVASKISQASQGQIFVDFKKLDLSLFPQPGIELTDVNVESAFAPPLTAKTLSVAPSITSLLSLKPGVSVRAEDILGGDLDLSTRGADKTKAGVRKQKINLDVTGISVSSLAKMADLPLKVSGNLSGTVDSVIDPQFGEQPNASLALQISRAVIPEGNIITPFGPFGIPNLNLSDVSLEAHTENGSMELSKFVFGKPGSDLSGNVTGRMDVKFQKFGSAVTTVFGGYDFAIHLQVSESFKQKFGPYLSFLQAYQSAANAYAFRVYGSNMFNPPNLTRIQ